MVWPAAGAYEVGSTFDITFNINALQQADTVVIQRPMHKQLMPIVQALQARGVAIVVEIDDLYAALGANNAAFYQTHPRLKGDTNFNRLGEFSRIADLVTCTTPALAQRYAPHGRVRIIPNYVPQNYLNIPKPQNDHVVVGWAGSLAFHAGDLDVCGMGVAEAVRNTGARYLAFGDEAQAKVLRLSEYDHQPGVPIEQYPTELARIDVGIVPLADTAFNRAKSALKLMEFSSVGAVVCCSPTPDNVRMINEHGLVASVCAKPKDWRRAITYWATHPDERAAAAAHNKAVLADLTYEKNACRWVDAWHEAADIARQRAQQAA